MAIVTNGVIKWNGLALGMETEMRNAKLKEGTIINIDYERPKKNVLMIS